MASLLSWLGKTAKDAATNQVHNMVPGAFAAPYISRGLSNLAGGINQATQNVPIAGPISRNFVAPAIQGLGTTVGNTGQILAGQNPYHGSAPQIAGQVGNDVLNAVSFLPLGAAARGVKLGAAGAEKFLPQLARSAATAGLTGLGYGATSALQEQGATPGSVARAGVLAGGAGLGLGVAAPVLGAGLGKALKGLQYSPTLNNQRGGIALPAQNRIPFNRSGPVKGAVDYEASKALRVGSDARGSYSEKTVQKYMNDIKSGKAIDPVVVTYKDNVPYIQDGKHRVEALQRLGINEIPVVEKRVSVLNNERGGIKLPDIGKKPLPATELKQSRVDPYTPSIPKAPNAVQKVFTSVRGELSQMGSGGREIATKLQAWRDRSEVGQQAFIDSIPTVSKLGKEFPNFVDALDALSRGEKPSMSPKIQQAVSEWSKNIPKVQQAAAATGKEVGNRGPFYFPRQYTELLKTRNGFNSAVDHLVKSGQAKTSAEAIQQLQYIKSGRTFGNFKKREFDIPGYDKSPDSLKNYIAGAFDDISRAEQFGPKGEISSKLLAKIAEEGHDTGRAVRNLDIALGNTDKSTTAHKVSSGVRKFNSLRSLGTAAVSNATQPVNIGTVAGIGRTVKGAIKNAVSPAARQQARETGVLVESAIDNLAKQGLGAGGKITRNIAAPFFSMVEKNNRQLSATVGSDWGNSLARKAAGGNTKALSVLRDKLGVTGAVGPKLTRQQEIQAARKLTETTQFKVDPQDLPGWVDSPMGKVVAQFRSFGYKQTDFMYNQVLREAAKGNFLPIARFVAVGVPAGAASQAIKGKIKGVDYNDPGESNLSKGTKALAAVGGLGLPGSEGQNLYKSAQYGNTIGGIAGVFGGPTASLIAETATNVDKALGGKTIPLAKEAVRNIPTIGPSIANRVFPTKEAQIKKSGDSEVVKLKSGKYYSKQTGKEYDSQEGADKAVFVDKFKKGDQKVQEFGGSVYIKNSRTERGYSVKNKVDYEFDKVDSQVSLAMDRAKASGDVQGWLTGAEKKYQALETKKKSYDPVTDQATIDDITLKQENLLEQAQKYQEYGGFKKGKSATFSGAGFKTASVKAPSVPKISIRKTAFKAPKTRKLSVSKIPSSYVSRKLS